VQLRTVGGVERVGSVNLTEGPTTGLVVSDDGHVLTSRFQFIPQPASVVATTHDGRQVPLKIVATDYSRQLVLLKAQRSLDIKPAALIPIGEVRVGQWAIGVGRVFRADRVNLSVGIVSAKGRIGGRALQTDAAVSPANYGGPLVDIEGQVLGIIAPLSPSEGTLAGVDWYDSGIGFAVPLVEISPAIERLKQGEDLYPGKLGIALRAGDAKVDPPVVEKLADNHDGDLQPGDKILGLAGRPVATVDELRRQLSPLYAGETFEVSVQRDGNEVVARVVLVKEVEMGAAASEQPDAPQPDPAN
jgi:serine protease Do